MATSAGKCHQYRDDLRLQDGGSARLLFEEDADPAQVDTDFYLALLMQSYFLNNPIGRTRWQAFSRFVPGFIVFDHLADGRSTPAGAINAANKNHTWGQLALRTAEKIMGQAALFAHNPRKENLVHLKPDQVVGEWRDSTYGMPLQTSKLQPPF